MRNFESLKQPIQVFFIVLFIVLIFALIATFSDLAPETIVNQESKTTYVGGETQNFQINLKTVDPEQFRTADHYREQYGRWRIESLDGKILSSGKITKIEKGIFTSYLTITIPKQPSNLIADIIEYQYSLPQGNTTKFYRDDGTIKLTRTIGLNLMTCGADIDCLGKANSCSTQTAVCSVGVCLLNGECPSCKVGADCGPKETCINEICVKERTQNFFGQISQSVSQPLSQSGYSIDGTPTPETAPTILVVGVFILLAVNIFLILQVQKTGKKVFGRRI